MIGGNLSLNTYSGNRYAVDANFDKVRQKDNYASLNAEYGQFITKGLLLGVKTNIVLSKNVALNVGLLNFNKSFNSSGSFSNSYKSSNIGLKFFLK